MWRMNGSPIFQDTIALTENHRYSIERDNTLIISNVTADDSGSYRCEVLGESLTVIHQVFVKSAPFNISVEAEGNGAEVSVIYIYFFNDREYDIFLSFIFLILLAQSWRYADFEMHSGRISKTNV